MANDLTGIHHVSTVCGPPGPNVRFYTHVLGLRLVKRTVNFDAPSAYHLYYGDRTGRPGTLVTFFPNAAQRAGVPGAGEVAVTHLGAPPRSLGYWKDRLRQAGVEAAHEPVGGREAFAFRDPDGTRLTLVEWDGPAA